MRVTQGAFSFLPDLTDEEIVKQIEYCLGKEWSINLEYSDDPHPRNIFWEMWDLPMFDIKDAAAIMLELKECRKAFPDHYIKLNAFDASRGRESTALSFIVNRPSNEEGFRLVREDGRGRNQHYDIRSYAADKPEGKRYIENTETRKK